MELLLRIICFVAGFYAGLLTMALLITAAQWKNRKNHAPVLHLHD